MPTSGLSIQNMFLNADPIVQGVIILLLLASLVTWFIIFEKTILLQIFKRDTSNFKINAGKLENGFNLDFFSGFNKVLAQSAYLESQDAAGNETRADFRERVERSMRQVLSTRLDKLSNRILFLATVGAASPFVGLFGTVWGIMNSFMGIADSGETSLAVVAPGIAEALFATGMGLVAAIPAVIAYNKITSSMKKVSKENLKGIALLGNYFARKHFQALTSSGKNKNES